MAKLKHILFNLFPILLLHLFLCSPAFGELLPGNEGSKHVSAEIVFDQNNLQLSESQQTRPPKIGLLIKVEPGWHIYWRNPGEAGKATKVDWILPPNWNIGELQWPTPFRFIEKGNIKTYSYTDHVLLYSDLKIPPIVPSNESELEFAANVSFLVCSDRCIPGKISVSNKIVLTSTGEEKTSNSLKSFTEAISLTPVSVENKDLLKQFDLKIVEQTMSGDKKALYFIAPSTLTDLNFFELSENISILSSEIAKTSQNSVLKIVYEASEKASRELEGTISWMDNKSTFYSKTVKLRALPSQIPNFISELKFQENTFLTHSDMAAEIVTETTRPTGSSTSTISALLFALLSAFLGGLALNVMPCVLPVLSIKLFGIIESQEVDQKSNLRDALYFSLGILFSFALFAVVAILLKAGGQSIGWGFQFQYPGFILGMIVFLFVLTLTFFDLVQFNLPRFLTPNSASINNTNSNFWKNFFDGLLVTSLSTPCTAPFLGTALAFAFSQSYLMLFLIFAFIGLGLCLPYLIIVSSPTLHRFFPKPGLWMADFKYFMGFCLIGTIIWLAYVFESLNPGKIIDLTITLFGIGLLFWTFNLRKRFGKTIIGKNVFTLLSVLAISLILSRSNPISTVSLSQEESAWLDFNTTDLSQIAGPKFIDFTAEWCITCKYNEKFILTDAEVMKIFNDRKFTKIKADWTSGNEAVSKALKEAGGDGVPFYVIIDENNNRKSLSSILTKESLKNALTR